MSLPMAYSIMKRKKMAKGGSVKPGCYADGGMVEEMHPEHDSIQAEDASKSDVQARKYALGIDEPMDELADKPISEMPHSMNSKMAEEDGDMESEDEPMKMARGGMISGKRMARMMMAKGGIVPQAALKEGYAKEMANEDHFGGGMDNEDIDIDQTTPHDDYLSAEGDYPLMEEEGYEEGHQAKMRRKGGILERVMAKIHSR